MPSLGFDTSSYPSAQVAPQDPLAMIGKVLQIQGAQQAIQNQQMEFKARQALGPILQQSIDPTSGELDINKFLVHGASNPDVAWKMPEITLQMIQRQNTQADTVLKTLNANKVRYGAMGSAAAALVGQAEEDAQNRIDPRTMQAGKPQLTSKQIASTLGPMVGENGLIDAKDAAEMLAQIAKLPNDQERFAFAKRFMNSARDIEKVSADIFGAITAQNTGGGTAFMQNRPMIGPPRQVGGLENTPSPVEMNAERDGPPDAQGRPTKIPRYAGNPMIGGSGAVIPGTGQGLAGTNSRPPNVSGLSPMEAELGKERAKSANEYEGQLRDANVAGTENLRILQAMRDSLKLFKSGGGADVRERFGGVLDALGFPKKIVDDASGGDRGAIQAFQKQAIRYATGEMKANMGAGQRFTNLDFSTFLKNNPTISTDPRALDKMFSFLEKGVWLADQQQRSYDTWKRGLPPPGYENADISSFPSFWTKTLKDHYFQEKEKQ